tara:strand:+ start:4520 stop:5437 length:918 start_codon:yes stop_codon:yes gene_type:complete
MALNDTTTWTGAADTDWDNASNWSNGQPDADGTAIIDGSVDIAGEVAANPTVDRVYVASTYTGQIGSSGTPLELDFAELSVDNTNSGSAHYIGKAVTPTLNTATVTVDGLKTGNALYLSGTIDKILVEPTFIGTMYLGVSASKTCIPKDLIMLNTTGTVDASSAANVAWASSSTIIVSSGTLLLGEQLGASSTLTQSGGTITVTGWTKVASDVWNILGGVTNWNSGSSGVDTPTADTVTTLNVYGGTFTTAANVTAQVGLTDINQYGGTVNLQSSFPNIEIVGTYSGYAGAYSAPKQSTTTTSPK